MPVVRQLEPAEQGAAGGRGRGKDPAFAESSWCARGQLGATRLPTRQKLLPASRAGGHRRCGAPGNAAAVVCPCTAALPRSRRGWSATAGHRRHCPSAFSLQSSSRETQETHHSCLRRTVPASAAIELIFLPAAGTVLCFGFRMRIALISRRRFGCC